MSHTCIAPMGKFIPSIRGRLDRAGIVLSGLCVLHCIASIVIVSALGIGGEFLFAPAIHRFGLAIALVIAAVAIGVGILFGLGIALVQKASFSASRRADFRGYLTE